ALFVGAFVILQHALDHRRAANARARDPADARRLAAPGAPLGRARVGLHRPRRLGDRPLCGLRARAWPQLAVRRAGPVTAGGLDGVRDAYGRDLTAAGSARDRAG